MFLGDNEPGSEDSNDGLLASFLTQVRTLLLEEDTSDQLTGIDPDERALKIYLHSHRQKILSHDVSSSHDISLLVSSVSNLYSQFRCRKLVVITTSMETMHKYRKDWDASQGLTEVMITEILMLFLWL